MAAQMLLSPGAHMIWQFEEMANNQTTKNAQGNDTSPKKVDWNSLKTSPARQGLHATFTDLCALRANYPALFRESAKADIQLSSTSARYISLSDGASELYLVVNPAAEKPGVTANIPFPKHPATGETVYLSDNKYELAAKSYNVTPEMTAAGVTLPAGGFAVYVAGPKSGISDIVADLDRDSQPVIVTEGRHIRVLSPYTSMSVHNLSGATLNPDSELAPGVYIVRVDSQAVKVAVL